jgi:hypothetical protein
MSGQYPNFPISQSLPLSHEVERALTEVNRRYAARTPAADPVRDYLLRFSDLLPVVVRTCRAVSERFGKEAEISLEVYRDPEFDDEYLTLYVRQDPYDEDILETLDRIGEEERRALSGASGWLLVTTDFQPPG